MKQLLVIFSSILFLIACNDNRETAANDNKEDSSKAEKQESREDRNKRIVREAMAAVNDHNIEKLGNYIAADAVDYNDGSEKEVKGVDTIKSMIHGFIKAFPDYKGDNLEYFADGNKVVVIGEWSGTFKNDLGKMKATGKQFKLKDADIFKLNDEGKITEHRFIQPNSTMIRQISGDKKK